MKHLVIAAVLACCSMPMLGQTPATQANRCRKNLKVDEFLLPEDANAAKYAFKMYRNAMLSGDRQQVVAMTDFPITLIMNGYPTLIATPPEFLERYDKFITPYVIESVRSQKPEELVAGWDGIKLSNGSVSFTRSEDAVFRVGDVVPAYRSPSRYTAEMDEFTAKRLTCPPTVVDVRITAYNWVSHSFPGFESIYVDHFIADVVDVITGKVAQKRVRLDFWGVLHPSDYNLPSKLFEAGRTWRMYLRAANEPTVNEEVCQKEVQEQISFQDASGKETEKKSAITILDGERSVTFDGLPCFEVHRQFVNPVKLTSP